MPAIRVNWDIQGWVNTGAELRRWKNMDIPTFVKWRAKIAVQDLIRWTPPRGKKPSEEGFPAQRNYGVKRISYEVKKLFPSVNKVWILEQKGNKRARKYFRQYVKERDYAAIKKILTDFKISVSSVIQEATIGLHRHSRGDNGRVRRDLMYPVVDKTSVKRVIDAAVESIGKLKAGWLGAARALEVPDRHIPVWVSRHPPNGLGIAFSNPGGNQYTITLTNNNSASKDMDPNKIIEPVLQINGVKMEMELKKMWNWEKQKASRIAS